MMNLENDMTDESLAEATDFGEPDPREQKPFWKRELLMGYSLPWILGGLLLALAGFGYLFGPSLPFMTDTPSQSSFSEVENTLEGAGAGNTFTMPQETASVQASAPTAKTVQPAIQADTVTMMTDIRDELNSRDRKMNDTLAALKDSVTQLSEAIKRDEAYAVETRSQLTDLTQRLKALEARQSASELPKTAAPATKRQTSSPVSGMKVMALENGMAWIKWQGSTWAVREGDTLGKVTVRHIDPASRTVLTTGGNLH